LVSRSASRKGVAYLTTLRKRLDELAGIDFPALSDTALGDFIPAIRQRAFPETDRPASLSSALACMVLGWACSIAALRLSRRWLGDQDGRVAKRLLSGAGNMASAESALDLWRLAAWACEHPEVARALQEERPFGALRPDLETTAPGWEFLNRWNGWMTRHGHHARGEMDIYRPRWFETPDYVLELLRGYLVTAQTNDVLQGQAGRSHERQRLLETSRQRLRNPVKRWLFTTLIDRARHGLAFRENVKSEAVRGVTIIRTALFEAGDRLVRSGVLNTRDDVFFLTLPELREALTRRTGFDASPLVVPRRAEFARNRSIQPPPVVGGLPDLTARATRGPGVPAHGTAATDQRHYLVGLAVSPGIAVGKARVILRADDHECLRPGEILVAPATDPGWTPYFLGAAAIVVDIGGQLSHGSILAREFGIPAVVNVGNATQRIRTGQVIRVDANQGIVTIEN
jgi:pyruvate,water dikinase